jgi:hypothetical protein
VEDSNLHNAYLSRPLAARPFAVNRSRLIANSVPDDLAIAAKAQVIDRSTDEDLAPMSTKPF